MEIIPSIFVVQQGLYISITIINPLPMKPIYPVCPDVSFSIGTLLVKINYSNRSKMERIRGCVEHWGAEHFQVILESALKSLSAQETSEGEEKELVWEPIVVLVYCFCAAKQDACDKILPDINASDVYRIMETVLVKANKDRLGQFRQAWYRLKNSLEDQNQDKTEALVGELLDEQRLKMPSIVVLVAFRLLYRGRANGVDGAVEVLKLILDKSKLNGIDLETEKTTLEDVLIHMIKE